MSSRLRRGLAEHDRADLLGIRRVPAICGDDYLESTINGKKIDIWPCDSNVSQLIDKPWTA
jgi:hypothetical protein